ncbi:hypothetical protein BJ993_000851 [Nocardioides aromaticivorans]|uniref:Uncharacterized protein n=1 Tax=Nocardioides aromaticivorans TaxID=200618 RepID=A0A7Z0CJK5_9ACTN|nr:hypothetical protein [Nocardioides aromaticivorans]NYI43771.1 hypothetical protein [Nocardioides aromaticivorans]
MSEPNDETWLREGLAGAVPEPPAAPDRAEGARAKARRARRTTVAAAGGVAASVLLVAGVVATVGGSSPDDDKAADDVPVSPYDAPACPAAPVDTQTQVGPDHVPDGASSVRLCGGNEVPIDVPKDALVDGVDDVAASINGLETAPSDLACTMELGPAYQLVFAYPDGSSVVASGELYGCRQVVVDGVERVGADEPWETFIDRLRAQRKRLDPPAPVDAATLECPAATDTVGVPSVGRAQDLAVAAYCAEDRLGSGTWRRAPIPTADLTSLVTDIRANTEENAGMVDCDVTPPVPHIVGVTAWGDRVDLQAQCTNGWFTVDVATNAVWSPSEDARAILERLFGEAR